MIGLIAAAVFVQTSITFHMGTTKPGDTALAARREQRMDSAIAARARSDSTRKAKRAARLTPLTPALLASAFRDAGARDLLTRARAARLRQDSSLTAYDVDAYERMSIGMGFGRIGRDHLLMRTERASHVRWDRQQGAYLEVKGQRSVFPMLSGSGSGDVSFGGMEQVPYFPGRETMWIGSGLAKADISDQDIIHPLANGSEAYYTYTSGDSVMFQLPGGSKIELKELLVRPRVPKWNVTVGSLWFDASTAQLVRAVYRLAVPMDAYAIAKEQRDTTDKNDDQPPKLLKAFMSPLTMELSAITVEYGLHEGRFWLPRAQTIEGRAKMSFMHVPVKMEKSYRYNSVNGTDPFPAITIAVVDTARDSVSRATRRARRKEECHNATERTRVQHRDDLRMNVVVRIPCDTVALATSKDLPRSIYDEGDEVFGAADHNELVRQALTMAAQADFAPQPPTFRYGLPLTRFNRIEGLSTGIGVDQALGAGYGAHATLRMGLSDWSPNAELSFDRSNGRRMVGLGVYRRLDAANDWTDPLGFRSSLSTLFSGRDEGFYYRSWGGEVTVANDEGWLGDWRLFAEQEFDAKVQTGFSLFTPGRSGKTLTNINAVNGTLVGLSTQHRGSIGLDPHGFRMLNDFRAEAGTGTFDYSRGSLESTLSHGLGRWFDGALTVGGGTSGGALPIQKQWFVG